MGLLDKMMSPETGFRMFLAYFGPDERQPELRRVLENVNLSTDEMTQVAGVLRTALAVFETKLGDHAKALDLTNVQSIESARKSA
jgi:hypothetical protein